MPPFDISFEADGGATTRFQRQASNGERMKIYHGS